MNITFPTLLIDSRIAKENIRKMAEKAVDLGLNFRPHFKTHQSMEIAKWFREAGIDQCAVSSVRMASYFARNGWNKITIAFPVNILEIEAINRLASAIELDLLIESAASVEFLSLHLKSKVGIWIKIDCGYHRTGIAPYQTDTIDNILKKIGRSERLSFKGFLTHNGSTYKCQGADQVLGTHKKVLGDLARLKEYYLPRFPDLQISYGDTPSCSLSKTFPEIDELRPGNFVFYDVMQVQIGSCSFDQIAVKMVCPVVALHPRRNEAVIYGGGVHMSKEFIINNQGKKVYGCVCSIAGSPITPCLEENIASSLSQEHGILRLNHDYFQDLKIGDLIEIYPVHSCMTANLMKNYLSEEGQAISMLNLLQL
ncbi:MAG: alanine racemase [Bacteroidota bacterium]|nr:alanine racemase [Bacteroidota bacterium]